VRTRGRCVGGALANLSRVSLPLASVAGMEGRTYTVAELSAGIARAVGRAFPDEVWVRGEIRDLSRPASGHVYFNLVEPDGGPGDNPEALLPVTLFASDKDAVNRLLRRTGAIRMDDGVEVRIRGRVAHYAARGVVQLRMSWIDADYTLGRLAAERERLLRTLATEGLLERNAALPVPSVPLRIGLVTSAGSAAEADFLDELRRSGQAWTVRTHHAAVQGAGADAAIVAALARAASGPVDVVAMVRGGGAQTDLAAFDTETVARAIATAPVPVFTGIGHEIDVTVADRVAARSYKTPTACAAALVGIVAGFQQRLDLHGSRLRRAVAVRLEGEDHRHAGAALRLARASHALLRRSGGRLDGATRRAARGAVAAMHPTGAAVERAAVRLEGAAARTLRGATSDLARHRDRLAAAGRRGVTTATVRLAAAASRATAHDPRRALARGWSLTRDRDGILVRDPSQVGPGDPLVTEVAGGTIDSAVTSTGSTGDGGANVGGKEQP
jgi:exodeoxyribonuclease VII large subunit